MQPFRLANLLPTRRPMAPAGPPWHQPVAFVQWFVMNGTNELCWRNANWTPATAPGCDGADPLPLPAGSGPARPLRPAKPAPAPPAPLPAPAATKVTYAADAFFDFDKSVRSRRQGQAR